MPFRTIHAGLSAPVRHVALGLLAALILTLALAALAPAPTFACSCAMTTIGTLDTAQNQIYVATAGEPAPDGTPMAVERWFAGPSPATVVLLAASSFEGDGANCGVQPFPVGSRWIVSAWAGEPTQPPSTGLCQPHAQLDTPEGQAMLAEAEAAYGPGVVPGEGEGPAASPTPAPAAPSSSSDPTSLIALGGIVLVAVLGLGLVYVVGRRRSASDQS